MSRELKWISFLAMLVFSLLVSPTIQAETVDRYIVGFDGEIDNHILKPYEERILSHFESITAVAVELTEEEALKLSKTPEIEFIEKDDPVQVQSQQIDWGAVKIQAPSVWKNGLSGKGVKVAIIDTGIDTNHPELDVVKGVSFVSSTTSFIDDNGHGTHVAGIIGAKNNQSGVIGIAHEVSLYAVKVLDRRGEGYTSNVIEGIEWALKQEVDLINLSMGGRTKSASLEAILNRAYEQGVLVIAAAGNEGTSDGAGNTVDYPAAYESVIAVAAVDKQDKRAPFSATGVAVEVAAPGVSIYSTYLNQSYKVDNGTSMAAPHVTAHLALLKQAYPRATHIELRKMLQQQTIDLGEKGRDPHFGYGRIEIPADLKEVQLPPGRPTNVKAVKVKAENEQQVDFEVNITWESPSEQHPWIKYSIYRNNKLITTVEGDVQQYVDRVVAGTYTYSVTAVNEEGKESEKASVTLTVSEANDGKSISSFTDVNGNEWFAAPLYDLVERDIIQGYPDGTVKPYQTITRAEAAVMMTRALGLNEVPYEGAFPDIRSQSYTANYIQAMLNQRIFGGYQDGTFRPHDLIARGEVAVILNRAFTLREKKSVSFHDVSPEYFGYSSIVLVANANVAAGYQDGTFRPRNSVTRAEYATFLSRVLNQ
ncbi:S8 family peptidase [Halalkalibacter urbisdiaboli]|uniref:S8 family peptidase n=1 Tax=Halalkalibacter urbisdiaboli TaxID=1960589 RepID=UPI000B43B282|nr:S8 family serine peptidase [Halalkalibacter urbisdiaboli]